jgi:hypothetical protein
MLQAVFEKLPMRVKMACRPVMPAKAGGAAMVELLTRSSRLVIGADAPGALRTIARTVRPTVRGSRGTKVHVAETPPGPLCTWKVPGICVLAGSSV